MRAWDHRMVFFVAGCATDSINFALEARDRFSSSRALFSAGMQVSSSKQLARISLEAPRLLSACAGVLPQVLRTHNKVADDDVARTSEREEDCLSRILRTEFFTRRPATLDFARIGNAPKFIQHQAWGHGSDRRTALKQL
jgi:hypothetical protein